MCLPNESVLSKYRNDGNMKNAFVDMNIKSANVDMHKKRRNPLHDRHR